jgi:uncharacterized membrane protein
VSGQTRYTVHDLGTLGGMVNEPYDLSINDVAVGRVLDPTLAAKAVLLVEGLVLNLNGSSNLPGEARGISSNGMVAGSVGSRGVVWQPGGIRVLDPLPGHIASVAYDINASGLAVGWSVNYVGDPTAGVWVGTTFMQLDVNHSWAFAVNDLGQIIGRRDVATGREARLWHGGTATTLPDLGGNFASPTGLSPLGLIITGGACQPVSETDCGMYTVIWIGPSRTIVRLGTFPGALDQNAWGANDLGTIIGDMAFDPDGESTRGIVWQLPNLAPIDLNTLIDSGGWKIESARAINQRGVIAAYGRHPGLLGRRAVLLRPKP